jgi:type I restriction enzyme S subunit
MTSIKTTLGEIAATQYGLVDGPFGSNLPARLYTDDGIPVVRGVNLSLGDSRFNDGNYKYVSPETADKLKRSNCYPGDIVFTKKGTIGQTGLIPSTSRYKRFLLSSNQMKITVRRNLALPEYVYYYVSSPDIRHRIIAESTSCGVPKTNVTYLRAFPILLPPLSTQRKIAAILSAYDDLIENNLRRIGTLEEMARRVYEEWFVNLRFPGHEKVRIVESELGLIPEGWDIVTLADSAHLTMGQSPKSEFYNSDGIGLPFHQGVTNFGKHFPTHQTYCTAEGRKAEDGDILMSVRAPVGRINLAPSCLVIGRGLCAMRAKSGKQWLLLHRLLEKFREEDSMGNGAIFKAVTKDDVKGIKFVNSPNELSEHFENAVGPIWHLIKNLTVKNTNLRTTRDLLLPKLISGEVDVSELDIGIPEEVQA